MSLEARMSNSGVEIIYADVHNVNSASNRTDINFVTPSSRMEARSIIDTIGCNYGAVTPYWVHEFTKYFTYVLPQWLLEKISIMSLRSIIKSENEWKRKHAAETSTGGK